MAVHAINVGQGDAFLLEFNCGAILVDTGVQRRKRDQDELVQYVRWFFEQRRPDLNETFDLVVISHSHADHASGVPLLFGENSQLQLSVKNYIDSGYDYGSAAEHQALVRDQAGRVDAVLAENITQTNGLVSPIIDPIRRCSDGVDPELATVWGSSPDVTGDFKNPNHHSVVLRTDFGESSFLFTGDIQTKNGSDEGGGMQLMLDDYGDDFGIFDVDALKVAHHGAENGTTERLLAMTTPCLAFMGVGPAADRGIGTAHDHGHPRVASMELLKAAVLGERPQREISVFEDEEQDRKLTRITEAIFGTSWDGHFTIFATDQGEFSVETQRGETVEISCS